MPNAPRQHRPRKTIKRHAKQRPTAAQQGYGSRWQKARKQFLQQQPLCVHCRDEGRLTPASVVDHVVPHKGDQTLFWSVSNWQPLCASCHSRKTAKEDGGYGNPRHGHA